MNARWFFLASILAFVGFSGCDREPQEERLEAPPPFHGPMESSDRPVAVHGGMPGGEGQAMPANHPSVTLSGRVTETMDAGRYTYLHLDTDRGPVWAAAAQMEVAVNDRVELSQFSVMRNFRSPTLDRTFEEILFANSASVVNDDGPAAPAAPATPASSERPPGHPPVAP